MIVNKLLTKTPAGGLAEKIGASQPKPVSAASNFLETLNSAIGEVDGQIKHADHKISELVTGKNKDIHGTLIAMEKADISSKMLMSVRNKMVSAYQEIMRIQI